ARYTARLMKTINRFARRTERWSFQSGVGLNKGRPSHRLLTIPSRHITRTVHQRFNPVLRALSEMKNALNRAKKDPPATARQVGGAALIFSLGHKEMATKMRPTKAALAPVLAIK